MKVKAFFKDGIQRSERLILGLIFVFTFANWLLLSLAEKLGPPDVYKLYGVAEKLFSGNFRIGIVPPLLPVIQYPLSKFLSLFTGPTEAFVLAGRLISLAAGLGVIWFTYLLLKKFTGRYAVLGIVLLVISPWYLKLLSFPITDMLYLFFATATFYSFLCIGKNTWKRSVLAVFCGVLTRFEGVLLILSTFLNYFKFKKKNIYIVIATIPVFGLLLLFFSLFADRFFAHLKDIILAQKSYLYIFQNPLDFLNVIYGNILFFIPFSYPYVIKMFLLLTVLALFGYGIYRLFKIERNFTIAIVIYEILFLIAKGYVDTTRPEIEFRRIFSGLWIFYLICFIGGYFFLTKLDLHKKSKAVVFGIGAVLLTALAVSQGVPGSPWIALALLLVPAMLLTINEPDIKRVPRIIALAVIGLFVVQIFYLSHNRSRQYVVSMAPKAAYAAAQWLNLARIRQGTTILSYTDNLMMGFYLEKEKSKSQDIHWETFTIPLIIKPETRDHYTRAFFKEIDERKVDYIIFDNYVVPKPEFTDVNQAKRFLYEERENATYFRLKKNLFYKGENVGYVLKPVNAETHR